MKLKRKSEKNFLNKIKHTYNSSSRLRGNLLLLFFITFFLACNGTKTGKAVIDTNKDYTLEELTEIISKDSSNAAALNLRAQIFLEQQKAKEAFIDASRATLLDSTKAEYFITAADVLLSINRTFNAKYALEKAISLEPKNEEANLKLAELYYIIRQYDKAMIQTDVVLKDNAQSTKAMFIKSMSFKEMGDTLNAITGFQKMIEQDENNYDAYMQLGVLYSYLNNPVAADYFSNAIRIKPNSEEAMYGKAYYFQMTKDYDRAIQEFTKMTEKDSCSIRAHFNLGYMHLVDLQVYRQAIKHFDDAIRCNPTYTKAIFNKGVSYESLGDVSNAKKYFDEALKIDPNYQPAKDGLIRLRQ